MSYVYSKQTKYTVATLKHQWFQNTVIQIEMIKNILLSVIRDYLQGM